MRGTHDDVMFIICVVRIIPAYAGNTSSIACFSISVKDHPRLCGEHTPKSRPKGSVQGSSPLMRGTLKRLTGFCVGCRIIPAYAGNTVLCAAVSIQLEDHPRLCGEHSLEQINAEGKRGSSPLMRGTQLGANQCGRKTRIIPAYAGNTLSPCSSNVSDQDHPRLCGEHPFCQRIPAGARGSSPLMRGTPKARFRVASICGIIPAYAGNTVC